MTIIVRMYDIHDRKLDLNLLLAFDALLREGGVTRAAAAMGLRERLRAQAPHCRVRTLQVPTEAVPAVLESGEADLALGSMHLVPPGPLQQTLFRPPSSPWSAPATATWATG